uniref:Uncharacterized protein n=1 Tax=Wuchereria bancrofti TaxID=6293 RepID=A0A1I8EF47_WUCBA
LPRHFPYYDCGRLVLFNCLLRILSKATTEAKGRPEVELIKLEWNWHTAWTITCCINSTIFVVSNGASEFSRRRIDLSRQVANKMATRRSVDYSNEYGMHGWTPRPSALLQAAWVKHKQQCAVFTTHNSWMEHISDIRARLGPTSPSRSLFRQFDLQKNIRVTKKREQSLMKASELI